MLIINRVIGIKNSIIGIFNALHLFIPVITHIYINIKLIKIYIIMNILAILKPIIPSIRLRNIKLAPSQINKTIPIVTKINSNLLDLPL